MGFGQVLLEAADVLLFLLHKIGNGFGGGKFGQGRLEAHFARHHQMVVVFVYLVEPGLHGRADGFIQSGLAGELVYIAHDIEALAHVAAVGFLQDGHLFGAD